MLSRFCTQKCLVLFLFVALFSFSGCGMFSGGSSTFDDAAQYDLDGVDAMRIEIEQGELFVLDMRPPEAGMSAIRGAVFDPTLLRLEKYVDDRETGEVPRIRYLFTPLVPCATSIQIKLDSAKAGGRSPIYKQVDLVVLEN